MLSDQSFLILVAGPYHSGPSHQPNLIPDNEQVLTHAALQLYQMGHLPIISEWVAWPLLKVAGAKEVGDRIYHEIFHSVGVQLIDHCHGVLRIGGPSVGADVLVNIAKLKGKTIFYQVSQIQIFSLKAGARHGKR